MCACFCLGSPVKAQKTQEKSSRDGRVDLIGIRHTTPDVFNARLRFLHKARALAPSCVQTTDESVRPAGHLLSELWADDRQQQNSRLGLLAETA